MLAQHPDEFGIAARILVLVRLPRRPVAVTRGRDRHGFVGEHLAGLARGGAHRLDLFRIGARTVAAAGRRH